VFAELNLHERLLRALEELNLSEPTEVQKQAIPAALAGRDLRVVARTGTGKTAAFVLPMLQRLLQEKDAGIGTRALILAPTRELARQTLKQVEAMARFTFIKAEAITGGEDFKVQASRIRRNPEILVATPGRMIEHLEAGNLAFGEVKVLVLDESDRMLDMGFSDDVMRLAEACNPARQTLLFSATPGGEVMAAMVARVLREPEALLLDSVRELNEQVGQQIITADDRSHKERLVQWLLAHEPHKKAIVFTNTKAAADRLGGVLRATAHKVFVLHGDKDTKDRKLAVERLNSGAVTVLVATDVAARGLDVDGLELVINFDMPRSGDDYLHRIGRTGRGDGAGLAISLVESHEWNLMASIQRYLRQQFEFRVVEPLRGRYQGPKLVKRSGKAVGSKNKKLKKRALAKTGKPAKKVAKKAARPARKGAASKPASDLQGGFAKPKRKTNPGPLD
tara:strand:- start:20220 stop:21572 length:1353 start_codon:yes stop_codon:yes gene_type:complete